VQNRGRNAQCCDLETMVSRLECTRVHFVQVSVLVSRLKATVFSRGGIFMRPHRSRLGPKVLSELVYAKCKLQRALDVDRVHDFLE